MIDRQGARTVGEARGFRVKPVHAGDYAAAAQAHQEGRELGRRVGLAASELSTLDNRLEHMRAALLQAPAATPELFQQIDALETGLFALNQELNGDRVRSSLNETNLPSIRSRIGRAAGSLFSTTQAPTETQKQGLRTGAEALEAFLSRLEAFRRDVAAAEEKLEAAGAPWTPGRRIH